MSQLSLLLHDGTKELPEIKDDEVYRMQIKASGGNCTIWKMPSRDSKWSQMYTGPMNAFDIRFDQESKPTIYIKGNRPHKVNPENIFRIGITMPGGGQSKIWVQDKNKNWKKPALYAGNITKLSILLGLPPPGDVLYDSHRDSRLHDGNERTIEKAGDISAGGLGVECKASGNPRIRVNADKTFSLLCKKGHGRFYGYTKNYNATMEIECAFWNSKSGQDLSLKMRSRHNENGSDCEDGSPIVPNRFGGYGLSVDRSGYNAKREPTHNCHDQSKSGSLPSTPQTGQFFKIEFTVKDDGTNVEQTGKMNGIKFMDKTDTSPKSFMVDKALYAAQSYFWVRQNIEDNSGTGEIRIKSLKIIKA